MAIPVSLPAPNTFVSVFVSLLPVVKLIAGTLPAEVSQAMQQQPAGYQQLLPRGRIASIDDPIYVRADEAQIRDEAWVLGVVIDGQARAFSLELLNAHEVVNDSIGGVNFAAVW